MTAFHARYTPKGLSDNVVGFIEHLGKAGYDTKYCAHKEGGDGSKELHYHIYLEMSSTRKTVVNYIQDYFEIPKGTRGMENAHYMVKEIKLDLLTFTLGYVQKDGNLTCTNMDPTGLKEALEHYLAVTAKKPIPKNITIPQGSLYPEEGLTPRDTSLKDQYLEYNVSMLKGITQLQSQLTVKFFRKKAWSFWRKKNDGLFPPAATQKRFLQSVYAEYLHKFQFDLDLDNEEHNALAC